MRKRLQLSICTHYNYLHSPILVHATHVMLNLHNVYTKHSVCTVVLLTPETVDREEGVVSRWRRVGKRKTNCVVRWERKIEWICIERQELASLEASQSISPGLGNTIHEATIQPWCNLIQLHPRDVGAVSSTKVIAVSQERDVSVGTAIRIIEWVAFGDVHVLVLWNTAWPLSIQHFFHDLLT